MYFKGVFGNSDVAGSGVTDPKRSLLPPLTAVDERPYTPGAKSRPPLTGDPSSLVSLWPKLAGAREGQ